MKKISFILITSFLLVACSSKKNVVTDNPSVNTGSTTAEMMKMAEKSKIANSYGSWNTLQTSGNISLGGSKSLSSAMTMKMVRGKSIYISVRPFGVMEVAKLVITGDTLIVVDKVHKRYLCENVKLITNGIPADVSTVQDIFLGRAFILGKGTYNNSLSSDCGLEEKDDKIVLYPPKRKEGDFDYEFVFDKAYKILSASVSPIDSGGNDNYTVVYDKVKKTVAGNVPQSLKMSTVISGSPAKLSLEYKDFKWNEDVKIDTSLPKNYDRMKGSSLLNLLGN